MSAALKIATKFSAVDKFSSVVQKMGKSTAGFASKVEATTARADRAFRRVTKPVTKLTNALGGLGLFIGGAAIVQGVKNMVGVFMKFEQANANLASVMSSATAAGLAELSADAKRLGATTAKTAAEVVGLQESFARLGFKKDDILEMTEATINGAVGMNAELAETADLTGAVINTFAQFKPEHTADVLDKMTLATQTSALNFEKLNTALPIVGGAAEAAGIGFDELLALMGKLSDAGIDASMSANALKNIFIESAGQGLNYSQIIEKIQKSSNKLTTSFDELGKRPAVAGTILADKLGEVREQTALLGKEFKGKSAEAANKQLATLTGALTILDSAYQGFILSLEDGEGAFGRFLTNVVQVITEMFALASNLQKATSELTEHEAKVRLWAERGLTAVKVIGAFVIGLIALKAIIVLATAATTAYYIAIGVYNALFTKSVVLTNANNIAQKAYMLTTKIMTAALWLYDAAMIAFNIGVALATGNMAALNAIMLANPIGLIIAAVVILIALIAVIVAKWDEWGAALAIFLGPLGLVISMIQSFRRNWDMITDAFKNGGIVEGIKAIGVTLLDAVLMPLQQLLEIAGNLPGKLGALAIEGAAKIENFRESLGVNTGETGGDSEKVNPAQERQDSLTKTLETKASQNVTIDVNDATGAASVSTDNDIVPINVTSTAGI